MTDESSLYELLDTKGERVGTAYVEHHGPITRWNWFAYVRGDTASNACLETSKQAYEELRETMKRYGFSVARSRSATNGSVG
jgi:hypothetical protein